MTKRPASPQSSPVAARSRLRPASPQSAPVPPAAPSAADPTFKILYVLAIIMIVDGHVGSSDYLDFNGLLRYQNYHIALFMFVSGYFLNLTRGYKEFFARKTLRLLVPLYLWNAAYGALCWYLNRHQGFALGGEFNLYNLLYAPLVDGHQFIYNMASWFLVPLFLVQAVGFLLLRPFALSTAARTVQAPSTAPKKSASISSTAQTTSPYSVSPQPSTHKTKNTPPQLAASQSIPIAARIFPSAARRTALTPSARPQPGSFFLPAVIFFVLSLALGCFALAYAPENHGARTLALTALRTLYFMPAFAFGFLYRHVLAKYDTVATPLYLFIVLAALTCLTQKFPGYNHIPSWLDTVNAPAPAIYAISLLAVLFWLRVARVLSPLLAQSRPLQYIANHTFDIMMHHFAGFMLAKALFLPFISAPAAQFPSAAAAPLASRADTAAALARIKSDIWYYPFPESGETSAWLYIAISIVIALTAGFTTRKIYAIISRKLSHF